VHRQTAEHDEASQYRIKGSLHPDPARGSRDWDYIAVTPSV
jgi:hypothetical protein